MILYLCEEEIGYEIYNLTIILPFKTSDIPLETYISTTKTLSKSSARVETD